VRLPSPLWSKSPLLLLRYPALFGALAGGFFLLALAIASNPFFVSAAGSSALVTKIDDATEFGAGATLSTTAALYETREPRDDPRLSYPPRDRVLRRELAGTPHLAEPVFTMMSPAVAAGASRTAEDPVEVRFLSRTDALEHVRKLDQASEEGVWMPATTAAELGLQAGDTFAVGLGTAARTIRVPIAGTYRALRLEPLTPYWRSLAAEIRARPPDYLLPPSLLITDTDTVTALIRRLDLRTATYRWEYPLAERDLTATEATSLTADLKTIENRLNTPGSALNNAFECAGLCSFFGETYEFSTLLPLAVAAAEDTTAAVGAPVDLLANASSLVGFALIAAAGAFVVARRRQEMQLLRARGLGSGVAAVRMFVEAFLPAVLGSAAGVAAAYAIVSGVGPPGRVEDDQIVSAFVAVAARVPIALVLLALVAALAARPSRSDAALRSRFARLPWEVPVLIVAALLFARLLDAGAVSGDEEGAQGPTTYLLLFPLVFTAGAAGLGARLFGRLAVVWRDRVTRGSSKVDYLAAHRLAGNGRLVGALITACAVAFGTFLYAETIVSSYRSTMEARSLLSVGSDVRGTISFDRQTPQGFPYPITKVSSLTDEARISTNSSVDFVAVESRSFARAAFWDDRYASRPLSTLMDSLREPGREVPVLLIGPVDFESDVVEVRGVSIPVRAVGEARAFPSAARSRPILVVDSERLEEFVSAEGEPNPFEGPSAVTELWVKGEARAASRALEASPARPFPLLTAEEVRDTPAITAFTRAFTLLEALGLAAALLVLVVLVLYLQARQRARIVSHRLSLRMGLTRARHILALWMELAVLLVVASLLAAGLALVAARLVLTQVEPLASLTPVPLFEIPVAMIAATVLTSIAVAAVAALLLDRASRRAQLAEVLRRAD
jgi:putative ABC transport system permease protein